MLVIGRLMIEHRLIERLIALMQIEKERIKKDKLTDIDFIDNCIDFIRSYAERCHHGKEEYILFEDLKNKKISPIHAKILYDLTEEHKSARKITANLYTARNKYFNSESEASKQIYAFEIHEYLKEFIEFYPRHIKKEDQEFFLPFMDYFTEKEKEEMLDKFRDFDRKLIHEKYQGILEKYERIQVN